MPSYALKRIPFIFSGSRGLTFGTLPSKLSPPKPVTAVSHAPPLAAGCVPPIYTSPAHCLPPPFKSISAELKKSAYAPAELPVLHAVSAYEQRDSDEPCSVYFS